MTPETTPGRRIRHTSAANRATEPDVVAVERSLRQAGAEESNEAVRSAASRAAAKLSEAGWSSGLADVAYGWADSPFGPLLVALTRKGLVRLSYPGPDRDQPLAELARTVSPRVVEFIPATDEVRRQLEEYFDGHRRQFDLPVDLSPVQGFTRRVLRATAAIPFGSLRTYREVATRAGNPAATRAAGNALGSNPVPIVVPCHRVVRTGGGLGGYTGGLDRKRTLLSLEGLMPPAKRDR
jgi:methylated-DNA-[protein]-cysteine S-methyltransferase